MSVKNSCCTAWRLSFDWFVKFYFQFRWGSKTKLCLPKVLLGTGVVRLAHLGMGISIFKTDVIYLHPIGSLATGEPYWTRVIAGDHG